MIKYIIFIIFVFVAVWVTNYLKKNNPNIKEVNKEEINPFEKKPFVFDIMSELTVYRMLIENFSDKYYVFPQMSYGRLIQVKKEEGRWNRNRFDKKIADFILCDKEKAIAQLVIELDGPSHNSIKKIERDEKIDMWMKEIGLPILHLKTSNLTNEYIKQEVIKKLSV